MSFGALLYSLLIMPLQLFFEVVFSFAQRFTDNPGLSIIVLSLTVNFLVLPLYRRADAIQEEQRLIEQKMQPGIAHIKRVFSGDERMMMLQTYYRQNDYKPTDVIKESVSLLIQIPFFIAAYRFLSNIALLNKTSFGPIADLGKPDALLNIGVISINLLPVIMTGINLISAAIYTKGLPLKSKIQLYIMALFFLVFLYSSPSGLVFYWTLNNLFSLIKNIFYKLDEPLKKLSVLSSVIGILAILFGSLLYDNTLKRKLIVVLLGVILQLPVIIWSLKKKGVFKRRSPFGDMDPDRKQFLLSGILLSILIGGLIPSAVIKASPQEFIIEFYYQNPLWYVVNALCISFGTFVVWFGVFYLVADNRGKVIFEKIMWVLCTASLVDYMLFGKNPYVLSSTLKFEEELNYTTAESVKNLAVVLLITVLVFFIFSKFKRLPGNIYLLLILSMSVMLIANTVIIRKSVLPIASRLQKGGYNSQKSFCLSSTGHNVMVIFLDRAIGPLIPYIMNEKPELKDKFDGFTYYSNVTSFAHKTNMASPALFGGYEYTPVELNRRSDMSLEDKHNESLKVMPYIFDDNGYNVTVCQPSYAGYEWIPDLSIFDERPEIVTFNTLGMFSEIYQEQEIRSNRRNFFFYGLMKISPYIAQKYIYAGGGYNHMFSREEIETVQVKDGCHKARGMNAQFLKNYDVLKNMEKLTRIEKNEKAGFVLFCNETPHEPTILQEPGYLPNDEVDNEAYDKEHASRFEVDGKVLKMETDVQYSHYDVNMASYLQLARYFDYLRENGVYDNTRIILVSDHGHADAQREELLVKLEDGEIYDMEGFACLLMVKDFDSHGFTTSDEFMTNGDVPTLAFSGLIDDPVNPFTGKIINNDEKDRNDIYISNSFSWDVTINNGNQFLPDTYLAVHDDIWNSDNWRLVAKNSVFTGE